MSRPVLPRSVALQDEARSLCNHLSDRWLDELSYLPAWQVEKLEHAARRATQRYIRRCAWLTEAHTVTDERALDVAEVAA